MSKLHTIPPSEVVIDGVSAAPGIAIGPVYVYSRDSYVVEAVRIDAADVPAEVERLEQALSRSERDLNKIIAVARQRLGDGSAGIFEAHMEMVRDPHVYSEIAQRIERDGRKADYAVEQVLGEKRQLLEASSNELLAERAQDLADVRDRIIRHLRRGKLLSQIEPERIVVAEQLTAADIVLFSRRAIRGCAMDFGGATSHVAIMARALGVPAVVGTHDLSRVATDGATAIVDGFEGQVILNPGAETIDRYEKRQRRFESLRHEDLDLAPLPAETIDGHRVALRANIEFKNELKLLDEYGAEGIGLFRTEMLFLVEGRLSVDEDEQFTTYKRIIEAVGDHIATIRLLDIGGDKMLPMAHREHNPFLGWRGIRVLLDRPGLLEPHLRAILRASAYGPTRLLIPMVTNLEEIRRFQEILVEQKAVLRAAGQPFHEGLPVGAMVEVPSAALLVDQLAAEVDFLSIGTNDLTQYTLAVDRGNDLVTELYQELHPAVLQLIRRTVEGAHRRGIQVSVCGEMAAQSRNAPILVGLGVDELSASPAYLPAVKRIIRAIEYREAQELADRALRCPDAAAVRHVLEQWLTEHPFDLAHVLADLPDASGHNGGSEEPPPVTAH